MVAAAGVACLPIAKPMLEAQMAVEAYLMRGRALGLDVDQLTAILREEIERVHTRADLRPADAIDAADRRALEAASAQEFARA